MSFTEPGSNPEKPAPHIYELADWDKFDAALRSQLDAIGHRGQVLVRNFDRTTFDLDENYEIIGDEVNRLQIAVETGTDRDRQSCFWDAEGHDHEHDRHPCGKNPEDIIYAYIVDASSEPYDVYIGDEPEQLDLTHGLSEQNVILVYNASLLYRASKNEHWFTGDPRDALLMIFVIEDSASPPDVSDE